jgi:hypothetical protein
VAYLSGGPALFMASAKTPKPDGTFWSYDWGGLKDSASWRGTGAEPPSFVVVDNWRVGGKAGAAFGPEVPVCAFSKDPREFAFICTSETWLGRDALIVIPKEHAVPRLAALAPYFEKLDPSEEVAVGRAGQAERIVTLTRAHALLRPYPAPYGPGKLTE